MLSSPIFINRTINCPNPNQGVQKRKKLYFSHSSIGVTISKLGIGLVGPPWPDTIFCWEFFVFSRKLFVDRPLIFRVFVDDPLIITF
jgi:hypothetical protein